MNGEGGWLDRSAFGCLYEWKGDWEVSGRPIDRSTHMGSRPFLSFPLEGTSMRAWTDTQQTTTSVLFLFLSERRDLHASMMTHTGPPELPGLLCVSIGDMGVGREMAGESFVCMTESHMIASSSHQVWLH